MDCPLSAVSDDGSLQWSDSHSMDSDDGHSLEMVHSPPWLDPMVAGSASAAAAAAPSVTSHISQTGQLSPVSTGMDIPGALGDGHACTSGAPPMVHSSSSVSSTDSWSIGFVDADDASGQHADADIHWDQDSDDVLTVAKIEPMDEDNFRLDDLKEAPLTPVASTNAPTPAQQPKVKRPRGRPRKHPLTPVVSTNKVTKGRSKTGCITCRKRKKKCDEAKPRCKSGCPTPLCLGLRV